MASEELTVTSEIYSELEGCLLRGISEENTVSYFKFTYPLNCLDGDEKSVETDEDGDLLVVRRKDNSANEKVIKIEHSTATPIRLVGLQVWRGALLLADYLLHHSDHLRQSTILEVGSGVGLTSVVASIVASHVICTDVDMGGILELIRSNVKLNAELVKAPVTVTELDFYKQEWDTGLAELMGQVDLVLAADGLCSPSRTWTWWRRATNTSSPPSGTLGPALLCLCGPWSLCLSTFHNTSATTGPTIW